jgi:hypothetical protein
MIYVAGQMTDTYFSRASSFVKSDLTVHGFRSVRFSMGYKYSTGTYHFRIKAWFGEIEYCNQFTITEEQIYSMTDEFFYTIVCEKVDEIKSMAARSLLRECHGCMRCLLES